MQAGSGWVTATSPLHLYSGQTIDLRLAANIVGKEPVGELKVECLVGNGAGPPTQVQMETETIASSLPLEPGSSLTVLLHLTSVVDTGSSGATLRPEDSVGVTSDSRWTLSLSSSVRSLTTTGRGQVAVQGHLPAGHLQQVTVKMQYSGVGADLTWCRKVVQHLSLVKLPSLVVSRWDVLPGDTQYNCFLVLDLVNKTCMEMELTWQ